MNDPELLALAATLAHTAGDTIMRIRGRGFSTVTKSDDSPVTEADHAAETLILQGLRAAVEIPVIAEEEVAAGRTVQHDGCFWLVDPLDGTREFAAGRDDFTVNIGLIEGDSPTMGVVYAPAHDRIVWGDVGAGAWSATRAPRAITCAPEPIRVRPPATPPRALGSRSHPAAGMRRWLDAAGVAECDPVGSSYKFALLAAGEADLYPRLGPTMEWDTAAGDAVLRAAGGRMLGPDGSSFRYRKPGFRNGAFVAAGAFDPPPIAATSRSGSRPVRANICSRASRPITLWKSRTSSG